MIDDKNKGIGNLLAEYQPPVRAPKVETQEDPMLSLSESLMRLGPLELPNSTTPVVKKKTRDGYQEQYNKYFNKKSDQYYKNQQPRKKIGVMNYINKMTDIYEKDNINTDVKYSGTRSDNPSWMKDLEKTGPYGKNKRFVNKTLNKFENRTDNKDVVTFDPTTQLFTNDTRNIAFKSYDQAKKWNDSFNSQPTATDTDKRKNESVKPKNPHRRLI